MVQRSKTSTTPAARLNPTYKLPVASDVCRFDKADGPAVAYTGGLYGPFSRYVAERPFSQSLALQTFFLSFLGFLSFFVLGQTNTNQSERLNCPEAPGARMIIADVLKHPPPYCSGSRGVWGAIAAVLRRVSPYYSGSRGVWAGYSGCFEARASLL